MGGGLVEGVAQDRSGLTPEEVRMLDGDTRNEAGCSSRFSKAKLDFHFRFSVAARIFISANALGFSVRNAEGEGPERLPIKLVARIVPLSANSPLSVLRRNLSIRKEARRQGQVGLGFRFYLGAGRYRLDWMLETNSGRVCSGRRKFQPQAGRGLDAIRPSLEPGQSYFEGQTGPPPWWHINRADEGLKLKILLNIPPFKDRRPLFGIDLSRIEAILTWLAYHPQVNGISVLAFNLKDQRVIYRQPLDENILHPWELVQAIRSLSNSQVRLETLQKNADGKFLSQLLVRELSSTDSFDAVVLLGPRSPLSVSAEATVAEIHGAAPVYYFKYRFFNQGATWTDPLQKITKLLRGKMFPIRSPQDLWTSTRQLMDQISARR